MDKPHPIFDKAGVGINRAAYRRDFTVVMLYGTHHLKQATLFIPSKVIFSNVLAICQYLVRVFAPELGSQDLLAKTELNHWCNFSDVSLNVNGNALKEGLCILNRALAAKTFLVGNDVTLADINVFAALHGELIPIL